MNRMLLNILVVCAVFTQLSARTGYTNPDYPACLKPEWLDDMTTFKIEHDIDSMRYYISSQKCLMLRGGIKVMAVKNESFGVVSFIYNNTKFWTMTEAIK